MTDEGMSGGSKRRHIGPDMIKARQSLFHPLITPHSHSNDSDESSDEHAVHHKGHAARQALKKATTGKHLYSSHRTDAFETHINETIRTTTGKVIVFDEFFGTLDVASYILEANQIPYEIIYRGIPSGRR